MTQTICGTIDPNLRNLTFLFVYSDDSDDEEILHVDPDPLMIPDDEASQKNRDQMGVKLQALLYHGMAIPLIKARWIILGNYVKWYCFFIRNNEGS